MIPWKSPEDRLNLSSEDKPDDQVKPLPPLTPPPPPPKKKIQDIILVTPQKYILNAQGAYNHSPDVHTGLPIRSGDQGFPMAAKSMTLVYLFPAVQFPICQLHIYTWQLEITAAALNIHIFFTSITHKFV